MDFNDDGKVDQKEAKGFFMFLWGLYCHMCSEEFLNDGPSFLAWRVFATFNRDKD